MAINPAVQEVYSQMGLAPGITKDTDLGAEVDAILVQVQDTITLGTGRTTAPKRTVLRVDSVSIRGREDT